jgi:hypothetical protein
MLMLEGGCDVLSSFDTGYLSIWHKGQNIMNLVLKQFRGKFRPGHFRSLPDYALSTRNVLSDNISRAKRLQQ